LTASAAGLADGSAAVTVTDNDVPTLSVTLDVSTATEGDTVTGTVTRNWVTGQALTVNLSFTSLYPQNPQLTVPASVVIAAGQASAPFALTVVNDQVPEIDETVTVNVAAAGFVGGSAPLSVLDNDLPILSIEPLT